MLYKVFGAAALLVGSASMFSWILAMEHVPQVLAGLMKNFSGNIYM
jgi:TRAP-type C4-dicarboxylate transport system permease large subunit